MATANDAVTTSLEAQGSAYFENQKYLESIEGKLKTLESTFISLSNNVLDSELVKTVITGITSVVNLLDKLVEVGGSGTVVLTGLFTVLLSKSKHLNTVIEDLLKTFWYLGKEASGSSDAILDVIISVDKLKASATNLGKSIVTVVQSVGIMAAKFIGIVAIAAVVNFAISKLTEAWTKYTKAQELAQEKAKNSSDAYEATIEDLETIKSQMDDIKSKLNEINTLENANNAEAQKNIEVLKKQNAELEREYELKKKAAEIQNFNANQDISDYLNTEGKYTLTTAAGTSNSRGTAQQAISSQLTIIKQIDNEIEETKKKMFNAEGETYLQLQERLKTLETTLGESFENLEIMYQTFWDTVGDTDLNEANQKVADVFNAIKDEATDIVHGALDINTDLLTSQQHSFDSLQTVLTNITSSYKNVSGAMEEMAESGQLSLDTVLDLLANGYDIKQLYDEVTGTFKLNTEVIKANTEAKYRSAIQDREDIIRNEQKVQSLYKVTQAHLDALKVEDAYTQSMLRKEMVFKGWSVDGLQESLDIIAEAEYEIKVLEDALKASQEDIRNYGNASTDSANDALNDWLALLSHRQAMNYYYGKEQQYIDDLVWGYDRLCKTTEERWKLEEMIYDAQREQYELLLSKLEEEQDGLEYIRDLTIELIKARKEDEIDALEESLDLLKEQYDIAKKKLQIEKEAHDYEKDKAKKQKAVTDIEAKILALQYDNSIEAKKLRLQLEEELAEAREELSETQYEHEMEQRENALDEAMDAEEKAYDQKIKLLEDYLDDEKKMHEDANKMILQKGQAMYQELVNYLETYSDGITTELDSAWDSATTALERYNISQTSISDMLDAIISKQKQYNALLENMPRQYYTEGSTLTSSGNGGSGGNKNSNTSTTNKDELTQSSSSTSSSTSSSANSEAIYIAEQGVESAKKAYDEAKKRYEVDKSTAAKRAVNSAKATYDAALRELQNLRGYLTGGVNSTQGLAMLHGTKRHSEVIFSSADAKKLWSYIHELPSLGNINTTRSLSNIQSSGKNMNIETLMNINVASGGVLDKSVLPDIKNIANEVAKELMSTISKTGGNTTLKSY